MNKFVLFIPMLLCLYANAQYKRSMPASDPVKLIPNQPRFYVTVHGGYSVALGSTFKFYQDDVKFIRVEKINSSPESRAVQYQATKKGLGQGWRIGTGLSYVLNDFLNVGLDLDFFQSTISRDRDSTFYGVESNNGSMLNEQIYEERRTTSYKTTLLTFVPHVSFKAISRPKFFVYNKIGAVLTFRPNSLQTETQKGNLRTGWQGFYQDSSFVTQTKYDWGIRNPSFGFMGAAGVQFKTTERLRTYAELQFSHILFRVKSRSLTSMNVNGVEMAGSLPVRDREIEFSKDFTDDQSQMDPNQPSRAVTQRFPISYVGLQVGIAYRF